MPRMLLPLQPDEKQELDRLRRATDIPLGVLVYLRKKGFTPVATDVARQHGLLPGGDTESARIAAP